VARPDDSGEYREGDPGVFIGGRLVVKPLWRAGNGGGSSRFGIPRDRAEVLGAVVFRGEPELELSESEWRSEGSEVSLANVGRREWTKGGELEEEEEFWVASMG
jgi:hypothetical protein